MRQFRFLLRRSFVVSGLLITSGVAYAGFSTSEFGKGIFLTGSTSTVTNNGGGATYTNTASTPNLLEQLDNGPVNCSNALAKPHCAKLGIDESGTLTATDLDGQNTHDLAATELEQNGEFSTTDYPGFSNLDKNGDGKVTDDEVTQYLSGTTGVDFDASYPEQAAEIFRELGECTTIDADCIQSAVDNTEDFARSVIDDATTNDSTILTDAATLLQSGTIDLTIDDDNDGVPDYTDLAIFDRDNDGEITSAEIVELLASDPDAGDDVDTSDDGIYARAYLLEIAECAQIDATCIATAIAEGNGYAVFAPQVIAGTLILNGADANIQTDLLTIFDGRCNVVGGNGCPDGADNVDYDLRITYTDDDGVTTTWENGTCSKSDGSACDSTDVPFDMDDDEPRIDPEDDDLDSIPPGDYDVTVTTTDTTPNGTYGKNSSTTVTVTVQNEKGCILDNGVAAADFNAGSVNSISGAAVTIETNLDNSNDILFIQGSDVTTTTLTDGSKRYTNLGVSGVSRAEYNPTTGVMKFFGTASEANWVSLFRRVAYVYNSDSTPSQNTRALVFTLSNRVPFAHPDGTYHFYEYFEDSDIHFKQARLAAAAKSLFGMTGYLATPTSQAEHNIIADRVQGFGWLGGCDNLDASLPKEQCGVMASELTGLTIGEGYWYWVTGPERLVFFGRDNTATTPDTWVKPAANNPYSNGASTNQFESWASTATFSEPNNSGNENYLHFYATAEWNDFWHNNGHIQGYMVEWGGLSTDPSNIDLQETHSYSISEDSTNCAYAE